MNTTNTKPITETKILPLAMIVMATMALTGCKPHEPVNSPATPPAEPSAPAPTNTGGAMAPAATNAMGTMTPTNTSPGNTNQ